MALFGPCAYSRAAPRISSAGTPVTFAIASGEFTGSATNFFHFSYDAASQRSAMYSSFVSPSVTTTCASALMTATFVPGSRRR